MRLSDRIEKRCGCFLGEHPTLLHDGGGFMASECIGCGATWTGLDGQCPELAIKEMANICAAYGIQIEFSYEKKVSIDLAAFDSRAGGEREGT